MMPGGTVCGQLQKHSFLLSSLFTLTKRKARMFKCFSIKVQIWMYLFIKIQCSIEIFEAHVDHATIVVVT